MSQVNPMIAWLKAHKFIFAALSVIGSIAGVGFSVADLHSEWKQKRRLTSKR